MRWQQERVIKLLLNIENLKRELSEKIDQARVINDLAKDEKRALTDSEKTEFNRLMLEIDDQKTTIRQAERDQKREMDSLADNGRATQPGEIRLYKPGEERAFVDAVQAKHSLPDGIRAEDVSVGRAIAAMVTGDWSRANNEKRVMATAPGASGGYLVPAPLSSSIIAMALNKMKVRQAGAQFVPMDSKTLTIPRVDGIPSGAWLAENTAGNFEDVTFGAVTLTAKKLMVLTSMSIELFEDGLNMPQVIENALADAIALTFDRAALVGDGAGASPIGLHSQAGVQELVHGEALSDYSPFSEAYYMLEAANETATGLIMPPRCFGDLDLLVAAVDGQYMKPPASWENYSKYSSNQIPITLGDGSDTVAFLGDFSKLLWGIRTELTIEATRSTTDAFKSGQVWLRAYLRGDIGLSRPAAFCKITGIAEGGE